MSVLDLAYDRIEKNLDELEVTDDYSRGVRAGLIDALETIDILDMELDGRLSAGEDGQGSDGPKPRGVTRLASDDADRPHSDPQRGHGHAREDAAVQVDGLKHMTTTCANTSKNRRATDGTQSHVSA